MAASITPQMELLAPGGDIDCIKAAIAAGADAVYCGLDRFNARNRAANIPFEELDTILRLAHEYGCEVFLTLNIILVENEFPALVNLLNRLLTTDIDGVIVQDLGLLYLLHTHLPTLPVHASTQLTTHNAGQIAFLKEMGVVRLNLSRELSLIEIRDLAQTAKKKKLLVEVFVHGANCLSFSGLCYMSSLLRGKSGNRGQCSQPCRDQYEMTPAGHNFPLNLKDNSAYANLGELAAAGVDSIKIEGRIKKYHYVYTVVDIYKKQLLNLAQGRENLTEDGGLYTVFNRDFSNTLLTGKGYESAFIENPRDHSAIHLAQMYGGILEENIERAKVDLYEVKTEIRDVVKKKIEQLTITKETVSSSGSARWASLSSGAKKIPAVITLPPREKGKKDDAEARLSLIISAKKDVSLGDGGVADVYFRLPARFAENQTAFVDFFTQNPKVIPWFPPVLIGQEYADAVQFLEMLQPHLLVTDNSGIGYEAWKRKNPWIAGPYLNSVNSYSLICLKEKLNCAGAFLSNELSRMQIRSIRKPDAFDLYYSIYHPIQVMVSRHCLIRQVIGCEKQKADDGCVAQCERSSSIRKEDSSSFIIEKTKGNYQAVFNGINFMNTGIVTEVPGLFYGFCIDLCDVQTETEVGSGKKELVSLFADLLKDENGASEKLASSVSPTTDRQYHKGI